MRRRARYRERRRLVTAGSTLALALGAALHARANPALPVELEFTGSASCPDPAALEAELVRRVDPAALATGEPAPRVIVHLTEVPGRVDATLSIAKPGRAPVTRTVTGPSCAEVLEATALILAVWLAPPPPPPAPPPPPPSPPRATTTASNPPAAPPARDRSRWRWGGGTEAVVIGGVAPSPLPGVGAFLDGGTRRAGWSPWMRAAVGEAWRSDIALGTATTAFRLTVGRATLCPLALLPAERWTLRACASATYGTLEASASGVAEPRSARHPWAAGGAELRLEVAPLRALALEASFATERVGYEGRFWLNDAVVHRTSAFMTRGGLGLGVRLP